MLRGFNLIDQMQESKAVIGLNMLTLWKDRGTLEPWIAPLTELIDDGTVQPVVSDAVPFDNAPPTRTGSSRERRRRNVREGRRSSPLGTLRTP